MKKLNVVHMKQKCPNCPFREDRKHLLNISELEYNVKRGAISPCHMEMVKYTGSENRGVEIYAELSDDFVVCKGYEEYLDGA